jgi:hypothetical protein
MRFYAISLYGKFYLWSYANQTLLWTNLVESRNCPSTFDESRPYRIYIKSVKRIVGCMEKPVYGIVESCAYKIPWIFKNFFQYPFQ